MAKYASTTSVSPEQRRGEIERTLARYGATAFGYATTGAKAQVVFELNGRRMRLDVALPDRESHEFTRLPGQPWRERTATEAEKRYQQAVRQRSPSGSRHSARQSTPRSSRPSRLSWAGSCCRTG